MPSTASTSNAQLRSRTLLLAEHPLLSIQTPLSRNSLPAPLRVAASVPEAAPGRALAPLYKHSSPSTLPLVRRLQLITNLTHTACTPPRSCFGPKRCLWWSVCVSLQTFIPPNAATCEAPVAYHKPHSHTRPLPTFTAQLLRSPTLPLVERLRLLLTASDILRGQGEALTIDRRDFYVRLYEALALAPYRQLGEAEGGWKVL